MAASAGAEGSGCPAYPWSNDGARGSGQKVFMQSDCAACHSMLPYAVHREAAAAAVANATEIVVVHHEETVQPPPAAALHGGGVYPPDLTVINKTLDGLRGHNNLYSTEALRKKMTALPTPAWLQFFHPYMRTSQAA